MTADESVVHPRSTRRGRHKREDDGAAFAGGLPSRFGGLTDGPSIGGIVHLMLIRLC